MNASLNHFSSPDRSATSRPILVLVPGFPGLSGKSWGPVDCLLSSFDVITLDLPGTGGLPRETIYRYEGIVSACERALNPLSRPLVLVGMSYGLVFAADLATRGKYRVSGFAGIAGPVTVRGMEATVVSPWSDEMTPDKMELAEAMQQADDAFDAAPSDATWKARLHSLVPQCFTEKHQEPGGRLLLSDQSEFRIYIDVFYPYSMNQLKLDAAERLKAFPITKVLLAGSLDGLIARRIMESDASYLGCPLETIEGAGHFVFFEEPLKTTAILQKYFNG